MSKMVSKQAPTKLGQKLKTIRDQLNLTLDEMAETLGRHDPGRRSRIHEWESGKRQPDLASLLAYARLVGVSTDVLIDDEIELDF
jgi:transcriptional regulator with XRE-family HTH domain